MRILSVDDDPIILEILTEVLKSIGQIDVTTAPSAAKALEIVNGDCIPFDCFLLDIQMPEIDGIQLCSILKKMLLYKHTPILMITAMSDKTYIDKAFSAGATDYITKPFDLIEINARIRTAESLVDARRYKTNKITSANIKNKNQVTEKPYYIDEKLTVKDVDGVINYNALENYVCQLSRGSLFGSTIIAFNICEIDRIFKGASAFDFQCLITDVAEAITFCLKRSQFLVAYAGKGTFVCVYSGGHRQRHDNFEDELRDIIDTMELCYGDGRPIVFSIVASDPIRLTFRTSSRIPDTLIQARKSAENKAGTSKFTTRKASHSTFIHEHPN